MKKIFLLLSISLFFPLSTALALYEPGSESNPIHVEIELTAQQKNLNKEAALKSQYGSSEYYSCRARACTATGGDPSNESSCLLAVEYWFERGLCGVQKPLECQAGYTMVNGSCYRQTSQPIVFPIIATPPVQSLTIDQRCKNDYGPNSYGSGTKCYCSTGYEWASDKKSCAPVAVLEVETFSGAGGSGSYVPPQDHDQGCKNTYGSHSHWDGIDDDTNTFSCGCDAGYQFNETQTFCVASPNVATPKSQIAAIGVLPDLSVDVSASSSNTPKVEPVKERRGFWGWLLGFFGL